MKRTERHRWSRGELLGSMAMAGMLAAAMVLIFVAAPQERSMGDSQRIVYIHVSVAWFGLLGFVLSAGSGFMYLLQRKLAWDHWAQAAAEVGWICATLTLITGSLWAHEAWNTWWTWDPRLTTSLILWTIYAGYFVVRSSVEDSHQRARVGAALSIVGVLDVPMVILSTRWVRGMHPVSPEMEPAMHFVLLSSGVAFTVFFLNLLAKRRRQLELTQQIEIWERRMVRAATPR